MPRIDVWDRIDPNEPRPEIDLGLNRDLNKKFVTVKLLGKGGFGSVSLVSELKTGKQYACKAILKYLDDPNLST